MAYSSAAANPITGPTWTRYGFGKDTVGGAQSGQVILTVDTLTDVDDSPATTAAGLLADPGPDGKISLREACRVSGVKLVNFSVAGLIELTPVTNGELIISNGNITIDGGDAPGKGICIKNWAVVIQSATEVIVRYMRFRPGTQVNRTDMDPFSFTKPGARSSKCVLDHCSFSWATDGLCDLFVGLDDVTVQYCLGTEMLQNSIPPHSEGVHNYGMLVGNGAQRVTLYKNFVAGCNQRNPCVINPKAALALPMDVEVIGNLIYEYNFGTQLLTSNLLSPLAQINLDLIRNFYKTGPAYTQNRFEVERAEGNNWRGTAQLYLLGNLGPHRQNDTLPDADMAHANLDFYLVGSRNHSATTDIPASATIARDEVLAEAGCKLPAFDHVDLRTQEAFNSGTTYNGTVTCVLDDPTDIGTDGISGWPDLTVAPDIPVTKVRFSNKVKMSGKGIIGKR